MAEDRARALQPGVHVLHPPLLAVYRVLLLYANNMGKTPPSALVRPALVLAAGAIVLWLVLWALLRNRLKAGIVASILIVAVLTGWHILEYGIATLLPALSGFPPEGFYLLYAALIGAGMMWLVRHYWDRPRAAALSLAASMVGAVAVFLAVTLWLAPIYGLGPAWTMIFYVVAVTALVVYTIRWEGQFRALTQTANWFAIILVAISVALIFVHRPAVHTPSNVAFSPEEAAEWKPAPRPVEGWPDIYFIMLEGYARDDVLRHDYHYNNLPFFQAMREQGFEVAEHSFANYSSTVASLASCLNMDYVQALADVDTLGSVDLLNLYHDNRVYGFLKELGYEIVVFSPGVELLEPRAAVDRILAPPGALSEFESVFLDTTAFARVLEMTDYWRHGSVHHSSDLIQRRRVLYAFNELRALARNAGSMPRFIYAHLLVPEAPFLFDREGGWPRESAALRDHTDDRGVTTTSLSEYRSPYVDQLHYTNGMIHDTVREILAASSRPPVILIASTRGPGVVFKTEVERLSGERIRARFGCLLMTYYPDGAGEPPLPEEAPCLVNLFRTAFNRVFGTQARPMPPEAFVSTDEPEVEFRPVPVEPLLE